MSAIEVVDHHVIYENPTPQNRSRHGCFPGLVKLPSGDLLALFVMAEAFEAADGNTMVSRSTDQGRTWKLEGPVHEKGPSDQYDYISLKPTLLHDGTVIATGYSFHRTDPEQLLANPDTDGVRGGSNLISFSKDEGRTWSPLEVIPRTRPELVEQSGPAVQLRNGTILGAGSLFPQWDGTNPSGRLGVLFRSNDGGRTWHDRFTFWNDPAGRYAPSEPRLCEMQDNRIVALVWTTDHKAGKNLPNHVVVSHDGGESWSDRINTGIKAQASNLMHWEDDQLLTIHCHREGEEIGVIVRLVDFQNDKWRTVEELNIWNNAPSMKVAHYATMGQNLKFGQASLLPLDNGDLLATHWSIEDGQGRIRTHRIRINV